MKSFSGKIIFWNGIYGFIQQEDGSSIFFHRSGITKNSKTETKLLVGVTYQISNNIEGKHKGKPIAINVTKTSEVNLKDYERHFGKLISWNDHYGEIQSTLQDKTVFFYNTRSLNLNDTFKNGDFVIFHQVKSHKDPNKLFALFAYPFLSETDITFLHQKYFETQIEEIQNRIKELLDEFPKHSIEDRFKFELDVIGIIDNNTKFVKLVSLLKKYNKKGFSPKYDLLKAYCTNTHLIQLWESNLINEYDTSLMKSYFHKTNADNKRFIFRKFKDDDKDIIINFHIDSLENEGYLRRLNNNIKTLLDIIYRQEETRKLEIYNKVFNRLFENLTPDELISLLLNGYIEDLPKQFIVENIDINNIKLINELLNKKEEKYIEFIKKLFDNYFKEISKKDFKKEYSDLIEKLKFFEVWYGIHYKEIISILSTHYSHEQKFVLWLFDVSIEFDGLSYFENNHQYLNHYYKIRFFLHEIENIANSRIQSLLKYISINQEGLLEYVSGIPWNNMIWPTEIAGEVNTNSYFFLPDVKMFIKEFDFIKLDINILSERIFNSLSPYQIHHLRLWLYSYVSTDLYDYVGFRECFKLLNSEEQSMFKSKGNNIIFDELIESIENEVIACKNIISESEFSKKYKAFLYNIFFESGFYRLRKEDGTYTYRKEEEYSSLGFNTIPSSLAISKIEIIIEVSSDNEILNAKGLEEIFTKIHTGEIEKALGKVGPRVEAINGPVNQPYIEDWKLRKEVIDYLNENQIYGIDPKTVDEPRNFFRRMDADSGPDLLELTQLFSLETSDGIAIIWENIDLSEDRATYVFKTTHIHHFSQIDKVAHSIVSLAQFRSTLISSKEDPKLLVFKNNLGFIGKIHKQRGKNLPFTNWLTKLEELLSKPIPDLPTEDELREIENWSPDIFHTPRIKKRGKINEKNVPEVSWDFQKEFELITESNDSYNNSEICLKYKALKSFNKAFLNKFHPENHEN